MKNKGYDAILQDYEENGVIPIAKPRMAVACDIEHECPWCHRYFLIRGNHDIVHCPYCCMEMELDWEL